MEHLELMQKVEKLHGEFHQKLKQVSNASPVELLLLDTVDSLIHLLSKSSRLPTTESRTKTYPLDVADRGMETDDTTQQTPASSQLGRAGTQSGRVVQGCGFAHSWRLKSTHMYQVFSDSWMPDQVEIQCQECGVLWVSAKIPAQGAVQASSTSARSGLNKSAESLVEESVRSQSKELTKGWWTNGFEQRYGRSFGPWHWHSGHSHPNGDEWHDHTEERTEIP